MTTQTISFYDYKPDVGNFEEDVLHGLKQNQKTLPCKYFYDHRGSELFNEICQLDEYYPTRTELALLQDSIQEIATLIPEDCSIIEFGSGGNTKIRILLDALPNTNTYVPIDISRGHLLESSEELQDDYPDLNVIAMCADYTHPFPLPEEILTNPHRLVFFPGSTIGNFEAGEVNSLLQSMKQAAGQHGKILIGVDLIKDVEILHNAYNDKRGVTAQFNKNLLVRINHELGGNFDLDAFQHDARFNEEKSRMEMHLVSQKDQTVTIAGHHFHFTRGETIFTESSHKYTLEKFTNLVEQAGFLVERVRQDPNNWFSEHLLSLK